jgi:hypothetical protein
MDFSDFLYLCFGLLLGGSVMYEMGRDNPRTPPK